MDHAVGDSKLWNRRPKLLIALVDTTDRRSRRWNPPPWPIFRSDSRDR